jgi:hypothetical protein
MRRLLAAVGLLVLLVAPFAHAQDSNGYSGGWRDPAPTDTSDDGMPMAYLGAAKPLSGQVSHPNGINRVSAVLVPDASNPPADGCDATMDPVTAEQAGTTVTFHVSAHFPCNLVYHVKATAQANANGPIGSPPPPYQMPIDIAVAIPPAAVQSVEATLTSDGDARTVRLEWPANSEPDLLGYVVMRVTDGHTETLGQVAADARTRFVDDDPPSGKTSRYEVTAIRRGPDSKVKQVPSQPTTVEVDVPSRAADGGGGASGGSGGGESGLTTVVTGQASTGKPSPDLLSSVRARGGSGRPASPPTTFDSGFQETLPFQPGDQQAAGAPTGGDNAVVATFDEGGDTSILSNKPTLTFIAGGLAVLVGAAVLFYVSRRAAVDAY